MLISRQSLNRALRSYDSALYCQETKPGRIDIYRRGRLGTPHCLFSLTDNWLPTGRPTLYGVEVILNRLRAMDLWRDDKFVENWIQGKEKDDEIVDKDRRNNVESFLYDFRRQFQRATADINTSTLNKVYREARQDRAAH